MNRDSEKTESHGHAALIRLGGLAIAAGLAIHIVLNSVIKKFPTEGSTDAELQAYLTMEAPNWAIVHGFRYVAFACILVFAAGLYTRTCCIRTVSPIGWGVLGLLGTAVFVTNGIITNGIEMLAFLNIDLISRQSELFWLLFRMTRVLFTAEVVTWSFLILGFSIAGWYSKTLPKAIIILGLINVAAGIVTGVFIVSAVTNGWASALLEAASITGLLWFVSSGLYLLVRGDK